MCLSGTFCHFLSSPEVGRQFRGSEEVEMGDLPFLTQVRCGCLLHSNLSVSKPLFSGPPSTTANGSGPAPSTEPGELVCVGVMGYLERLPAHKQPPRFFGGKSEHFKN